MLPLDDKAGRMAGFLVKKVNRAIYRFGMIENGDRLAVALSGGKDSFSLLRILDYRRRFVPEDYSVVALHVVGDARGNDMPPYPQLEKWLVENGVEYAVRPSHLADDEALPMPCQRCTWNRRRTIFEMAAEMGCNKVAFGHHLDDLAQTALLNLTNHGKLETMEPVRTYFGGSIKLIRPFIYVPEEELKRFAAANSFPTPPPECQRGLHTARKEMKDLIAQMRKGCREVRMNIVRAAMKREAMSDE